MESSAVILTADFGSKGIREKQTGVDTVTIGGSLASNVHGRGLTFPPFVHDVESFDLLDAKERIRRCSRSENVELFALAIGGYGLFGLVTYVTLRLVRRFKVRRQVENIAVRHVLDRYYGAVDAGCVYGDCQYSVDLTGGADDHPAIMPCYEPVDDDTRVTEAPIALSGDLSHDNVMLCLAAIPSELAARQTDLSYGTIRFIEADKETFLPWARQRSVCIVCNLHVRHTSEGIANARSDCRAILDRVTSFGGSFYLT